MANVSHNHLPMYNPVHTVKNTSGRLFTGPLSDLNGFIAWADEAPVESVDAREVFSPAGLDRMIERHSKNYAPGDARAVLSIWSKYYLATMIYPWVTANLMLGRTLPMALDQVSLVLADTGEVQELVLRHEGHCAPEAGAAERFLPLLDDNLTPAIDAMAAHSGLSPRVYWSNAGHYFHHLAHMLAAIPDAPPAVHQATELMELQHLADGRRNPLFRPVKTQPDANGTCRTMRRLCCVRFLLDNLGYCDNCPLELLCTGQSKATL